MNNLKHYYLQQMGIESWLLREDINGRRRLRQLADRITACTNCPLHENCGQKLAGRGELSAKVMIIVDSPSLFENKAGELLNNMLASIGLDETQTYITPLIKCHSDRPPVSLEQQLCVQHLRDQIQLMQPAMLLILSETAAQLLLQNDLSTVALRGTWHNFQNIPTVVSFAADWLLTNPADKARAYHDLLMAVTPAV